MRRMFPVLLLPCLSVLAVLPVAAQTASPQVENVRVDYAQVLNVEPVYETLRATRMERQCDPVAAPGPQVQPEEESPGRWSRMIDSVKGLWSRDDEEESEAPVKANEPMLANCRMVPVRREFQRPIAYDVDYVYRGTKYRSRLLEDPGNRLRIRISVTPYMQAVAETTP